MKIILTSFRNILPWLLTLAVLPFSSPHAFAASNWDDFTLDHLWRTEGNWLPQLPQTSDSTFVKVTEIVAGGTGPIIDSETAAVARNLNLESQGSGQTVSMEMTGGTLDLYFEGADNIYFRLGAGPGPGTALFDMSGGTMTVDIDPELYVPGDNALLRVGSGYTGILNMTNDARIEAWDLVIASEGTVDMSDSSTIILRGDDTSMIQGFIDEGSLVANGGTGVPSVSYDPLSDLTTIQVGGMADSADFDSDGDVDGEDFLIWQRGFESGSTLAEGDANNDSQVTGADLLIWEEQFGTAPAEMVSVVPEPNFIGMAIVVAMVSLSMRKREIG